MENKIEKIKKENQENETREFQFDRLVDRQKIDRKERRIRYRLLFYQISLLFCQNIFLSLENQSLIRKNQELKEKLQIVGGKGSANPKRDPMTAEIYKKLLKAAAGGAYSNIRLRIALCLLLILGLPISSLLFLRVYQIKTLVTKGYIALPLTEPSAFLTKEGQKVVKDRQKDFQVIFSMKEENSYIFTNHSKILSRETFTKAINLVTRKVSEEIPSKPNITSHSFRIGYITELWQRGNFDIESIRRTIEIENLRSNIIDYWWSDRQKEILSFLNAARFDELSTQMTKFGPVRNPHTEMEALTVLQAENQNLVSGISRPDMINDKKD